MMVRSFADGAVDWCKGICGEGDAAAKGESPSGEPSKDAKDAKEAEEAEEEMQKVEVVEMEEELDPGQVVTSMDPHLEVHQTSEDMAGIMVHLEPIPAPSDPGNYRPPSNELELVMGGLGCCDRRRFN